MTSPEQGSRHAPTRRDLPPRPVDGTPLSGVDDYADYHLVPAHLAEHTTRTLHLRCVQWTAALAAVAFAATAVVAVATGEFPGGLTAPLVLCCTTVAAAVALLTYQSRGRSLTANTEGEHPQAQGG